MILYVLMLNCQNQLLQIRNYTIWISWTNTWLTFALCFTIQTATSTKTCKSAYNIELTETQRKAISSNWWVKGEKQSWTLRPLVEAITGEHRVAGSRARAARKGRIKRRRRTKRTCLSSQCSNFEGTVLGCINETVFNAYSVSFNTWRDLSVRVFQILNFVS